MTNNTKNTSTTMALVNSIVNQPIDPAFFTLDSLTKWGPDQEKVLDQVLAKPADTAAASTPAAAN
jgi:hypothetical protein